MRGGGGPAPGRYVLASDFDHTVKNFFFNYNVKQHPFFKLGEEPSVRKIGSQC